MRISDWSSDVCSSDLDTEIIVHLIARSRAGNVIDRIVGALHKVEGAYSLGALTQKKLIGVREPFGVRPLVLGRLGDAWIIASETCAFVIIGAELVRDIVPGEMVVIDSHGLRSLRPLGVVAPRRRGFEYLYFPTPETWINGFRCHTISRETCSAN